MDRYKLNRRQLLAGLASSTLTGFLAGQFFGGSTRPRESDFFETPFVNSSESETGLFEDESFFLHDLSYHPESASRLRHVHDELPNFPKMAFRKTELPKSSIQGVREWVETLAAVHDRTYLESLSAKIDQREYITKSRWSPYGGPHARAATYRAANGTAALAMKIATGELRNGFALIRPPGHHAGRSFSGGYCLINSIAFAAHKIATTRRKPVLILDLDVHHGNGTEDIFYASSEVSYVSLHQDDWPYTGHADRIGEGEGKGFNFNLPLPLGLNGKSWLEAVEKFAVPIIEKIRPSIVLVSMGYDTHWRDPQGSMLLTVDDQISMVASVQRVAESVCGGRVLYVLEGGYERRVSAFGVLNTLNRLYAGKKAISIDPFGAPPESDTEKILLREKEFAVRLESARRSHRL